MNGRLQMKIKTIIKLADVLDDSRRMPCDMYKLDEVSYVSESRGDSIPIADMDIVHLVRAFKKDRAKCVNHVTDADLIKQNRDLVSANKTLGRLHDMWKEKAMNIVEKSSYDDLKKQTDVLVKDNSELRFQMQQVDRNQTVSKEAYDVAWNNNEELKKQVAHWKKLAEDNFIQSVDDSETSDTWKDKYEAEVKNAEYWKDLWNTRVDNLRELPKGCGYVFSEIPNDCDGQRFTDDLKKYLNKESYKLRVRGQYLDEKTKKTEGWRRYEMGQPMDKSKCLRVYVDVK